MMSNLKRAAITVIGAFALIGLLVGGWALLDRRADSAVREWINGPRTDPVTYVAFVYGTRQTTLDDPGTLAYLSSALPVASRDFQTGGDVSIELRFKSGRVVQTIGQVTQTCLVIQPPSGDLRGNADIVTLHFGRDTPAPLANFLATVRETSRPQ